MRILARSARLDGNAIEADINREFFDARSFYYDPRPKVSGAPAEGLGEGWVVGTVESIYRKT